MIGLLALFFDLPNMVIDFCARTMTGSKPCPPLSGRQRSARCMEDEGCVKETLPRLAEAHARQTLSSEINSTAMKKI